MSKGGKQQVTQTVDPATQAYVNQMRQYALGATGVRGNAPPLPPELAQAQQQFQNYAQGGNLGFSALTGNADAAQQFLNPYTSQMNPFFAQQRALAVQGANDQATQMGAFGGDRSQIGAAVAGSQADQNQAGFQYDAFNQAMQRALQAANFGYGASANAAFLPQQYYGGQLGLLNAGTGPYGMSTTTKTSGDIFSQGLGLLGVAGSLGWHPFGGGGQGGPSGPYGPGNFPTPGIGYGGGIPH